MTPNTNIKSENQEIKFNLRKLEKITFGNLEGERDNILKDCFFPTYKIRKYLNNPVNYILSPKGAGKSALFRSIESKFIDDSTFDYKNYSIITINDAFGFDDEYLNVDNFSEKSRMKLTISWGVFILSKLINDIKKNHSTKEGYKELINEISKTNGFKEKFNLYGLNDLLKSISTSINFKANGQEFELKPSFEYKKSNKKLILNVLYNQINIFYKKNNLKALVLIDRIDNFVQKEKYSLQKKYIQGLFDSIEEISLLENIHPTLFLRTDLFYSYESDIEFDKVKDRTIELSWNKGETLNFLLYRFNNNQYIKENFGGTLKQLIEQEKTKKISKPKREKYLRRKIKSWFKSTQKNHALKDKQAYNYRVSEKFLTTFFPKDITNIQGEEINFIDWIFDYLKDANDFVNPRLLIDFFNQLIEFEVLHLEQFCYENENFDYVEPNYDTEGNLFYNNIFHQNSFMKTYEKTQNDALKNILVLIKSRNFQILFKEINSISYHREFFKYGDINMNRFNMDKDTFDNLLKYLKLLGFCKEIEKQKFYIPPIYRKKIELIS